MKQSLFFAISIGAAILPQSAFSETYPWSDRDHHCIVESASYVPSDASDRGVWIDAPTDFKIRLSNCSAYQEGEKLWGDKHPNVMRLSYECRKHGDTQHRFQVVEPFPPFAGVVTPIAPSRLTHHSLSSDSGVLFRLHEDGGIDIGKLHQPSDKEANAWKLVTATCAPQSDD